MSATMSEKERKRPGPKPKPPEEKATRTGRSYTMFFNHDQWARLEAFMATIGYTTEYKEHIEKAMDLYLEKYGHGPKKPGGGTHK